MEIKVGEYDLIFMTCPECKRKMKMSVARGEEIRFTWCTICGKPVIWEAWGDEDGCR